MSESIRLPESATGEILDELLTAEALVFVEHLHKMFNPRRRELLQMRSENQDRLNRGEIPDFSPETREIRGGRWQVAKAPADLLDRRVEITGPTDQKMMINALNSGARVFMADLEDSLAPSWDNVIYGQLNLKKAVRREIDFVAENGKEYKLAEKTATLVVRPRGWHLEDRHITVGHDLEYISASLLDFGLYFFHNARFLLETGSGPYFYLPKLEHHLEARLWNDVFIEAQKFLGIPAGSVRATVLIETIMAAFQMEEILFELKEHAAGLNAGRWDYIFSMIKKFQSRTDCILPDRGQVTMTVPFMRAYTELLVKSCHMHGAHAIGGMSAFIPNRKLKEVNDRALKAVREDKEREAKDGFDGTWVAHPDLVPVALEAFDVALGSNPHQKDRLRDDVHVAQEQLLPLEGGTPVVTEEGFRTNVQVAIQYISSWLGGLGAVAINHLMEDAATAEISRAQLWQWIRHAVPMNHGQKVTRDLYREVKAQVIRGPELREQRWLKEAGDILDEIVLGDTFQDFLTIPAYQVLTRDSGQSLSSAVVYAQKHQSLESKGV